MLPMEWAKGIINKCFDRGLEKVLKSEFHTTVVSDWERDNYSFLKEQNLDTASGATKFCLISDNLGWVIKAGFNVKDYMNGKIIDFCEIEYKNYIEACKEKLDKFFAPIFFIGNFNGFNFYLQEKEDMDEGAIEESLERYYSSEYEVDELNSFYWDDLDDEERVVAILGDEKDVGRLLDFISERNINDLHSANWGINEGGDAVLIDYSGYF